MYGFRVLGGFFGLDNRFQSTQRGLGGGVRRSKVIFVKCDPVGARHETACFRTLC